MRVIIAGAGRSAEAWRYPPRAEGVALIDPDPSAINESQYGLPFDHW